ncbi:MAG TPA: hypothetical protein EYO18_07030 [Candidatus Marinimicrobia bacterium]|nr:hypothetical protein [Candidatus Neomarinimicrobiota bacterium]
MWSHRPRMLLQQSWNKGHQPGQTDHRIFLTNYTGGGVQGDLITSPFFVTEIPFQVNGSTEDFNDDYDESCPYTGSTSPDVVYQFDSPGGTYDFSLCESGYDTKIYIYDNSMTNIACNDDACSNSAGDQYRSLLENVSLDAGTYFVIVDGYGGDNGDYELLIDYTGSRSYSYNYDPADKKSLAEPVAVYRERGSGFISFSSELLPGSNELQNPGAENVLPHDRDVVTHYSIFRSREPENSVEEYSLINTVPSEDAPPYTDFQVENERQYYYSVSALDDQYGESDRSAVASAVPLAANALPYMTDLENDDGGFIAGDITQWDWGTPEYGPEEAFSGENVWGTNLDGSYQDNSEELLYNIFNIPESSLPMFFRFP